MWMQSYMDGSFSLYECVECGKQVKELPEGGDKGASSDDDAVFIQNPGPIGIDGPTFKSGSE